MRLQLGTKAIQITVVLGAITSAPTRIIADDAPGSQGNFGTVRTGVSKFEASLSNLHVKADVKKQVWKAGSKTWDDAGTCKCEAWFDRNPDGKSKVDVHRDWIPWFNGTRPFDIEDYSVAFDGQRGVELITGKKIPGHGASVDKATITKDPPSRLEYASGHYAGWAYSIFGVESESRKRLSQIIATATGPGQPIVNAVAPVVIGDSKCTEITVWSDAGSCERFDLDPARSYALVRREGIKNGAVLERTQVESFLQAAPGIFCPHHAIYERNFGGAGKIGEPCSRLDFTANEATANDPDFTETLFKVGIPPTAVVKDLSHPGL